MPIMEQIVYSPLHLHPQLLTYMSSNRCEVCLCLVTYNMRKANMNRHIFLLKMKYVRTQPSTHSKHGHFHTMHTLLVTLQQHMHYFHKHFHGRGSTYKCIETAGKLPMLSSLTGCPHLLKARQYVMDRWVGRHPPASSRKLEPFLSPSILSPSCPSHHTQPSLLPPSNPSSPNSPPSRQRNPGTFSMRRRLPCGPCCAASIATACDEPRDSPPPSPTPRGPVGGPGGPGSPESECSCPPGAPAAAAAGGIRSRVIGRRGYRTSGADAPCRKNTTVRLVRPTQEHEQRR